MDNKSNSNKVGLKTKRVELNIKISGLWMLNILATRCVYHVVYARVDAKEKVQNMNTKNTSVTWFSLMAYVHRENPKGLHL